MLVSILCPTRNRVDGVRRLIESFRRNTFDPAQIELLIKIDADDAPSVAFFNGLNRSEFPFELKVYSGPRSPFLNEDYYNYLARRAKGRFVWAVGDDTLVETEEWDRILKEEVGAYYRTHPDSHDEVLFISIDDTTPRPDIKDCPPFCCFPIITKKAVDVLGFMFHPDIMTWGADYTIFEVYSDVRINRVLPLPRIRLRHVCHHNASVAQDTLNKNVQFRWLLNSCAVIMVKRYSLRHNVRALGGYIHSRQLDHRKPFWQRYVFEPMRYFIRAIFQVSFGFRKEGRQGLNEALQANVLLFPLVLPFWLFSFLPGPFYRALFFLYIGAAIIFSKVIGCLDCIAGLTLDRVKRS